MADKKQKREAFTSFRILGKKAQNLLLRAHEMKKKQTDAAADDGMVVGDDDPYLAGHVTPPRARGSCAMTVVAFEPSLTSRSPLHFRIQFVWVIVPR